jgi:hypothetical protein
MNIWLKRVLYGIVVAAGQFVLLQYMKFDFITTLVLCGALALLMYFLEHKNFAWGIIIGSALLAAYGYMFIDSWSKVK